MTTPILQLWSAPKCQIGAQPLAALPASVSGTITESLGGNESGTIVLDTATATAAGLSEGRVLRALLPLRGVQEWVITQVSDSVPGSTVTATLGPLRQLLALRGFVRETTAATTTLSFRPDPLTVSDVLTRYVLTNLTEDGLDWLSVGTVEYTDQIDLGTFTAVRRGEVLSLIEKITGYEVVLRRLDDDTGYVIDVLAQRGSTLAPALLEVPGTALQISRSRDLTQTATAVLPIGVDERPMGEVDWTGGVATGTGPYWIPLTDPTGGPAPIREDGQFVGTFLLLPDGTTIPVAATRASDSAVQVTTLGTYATGQRVILIDTTDRRPVSLITSPSALAEARGLVVARVSATGARQERTLNRNAGFEDNATHWSDVNGTGHGVPIGRTELAQTITFAANGFRAGGTSTAIPLAVDGLAANAWVRRGDTLRHQSASRAISATAQSSATGVLTLSIGGGGIPVALTDGNTMRLGRVWQAAASTAIAMPRLAGVSYLTAASIGTTDLQLMLGDRRLTEPGGYTFAGPNGFALNFYEAAGDPTRIAVQYAFTSNDPATEAALWRYGVSSITATGAQQLTLVWTGTTYGTGGPPTVGQWVVLVASADWGAIGLSATDAPYLYFFGSGLRLLGQVSSLTSDGIVLSLVGYPSGADFRNVGTITPTTYNGYPEAPGGFSDPEVPVALGLGTIWPTGTTLTLSRLGRARTVQADGAYPAGATSVTMKPITAISTRAWQTGDMLYIDASPVQSYPVTSGVSVTASTGIAAVPVSIPTGVTIRRGTRVWSNWHGSSTESAMLVATTVTGPASALDVFHGDTLNADEATGGLVAAYRVPGTSSVLEFPGNVMVAAASVQANGSGQASVTLVSVPANDIADNAVITITRPTLFGVRDRQTGAALRLYSAAGSATPAIGVGAAQSEGVFIPVLAGESRPVRVVARFRVTPETLGVGQAPVVAIVNTGTSTMLAWGTISASTTYALPYGEIECTASTVLTASATLAVRLYGGSNTNFDRWHLCTDAALYVGTDVLPYVAGARSRISWHRAQDVLALRRRADRYQLRGIDLSALTATGIPLQLGQAIRLRAPDAGIETRQRIVRLVWRWPGAELVEVEAGALTPRLTDVTVSL